MCLVIYRIHVMDPFVCIELFFKKKFKIYILNFKIFICWKFLTELPFAVPGHLNILVLERLIKDMQGAKLFFFFFYMVDISKCLEIVNSQMLLRAWASGESHSSNILESFQTLQTRYFKIKKIKVKIHKIKCHRQLLL